MQTSLFRKTLSVFIACALVSSQALAVEKASEKSAEKTTEKSNNEKLIERENREGDKKLENKTAQEIADLVKDLDYPELQVVPRASDRLKLEARDEGRGWFYAHWPIQLAGLATLATATYGKGQIRVSSDTNVGEQEAFEKQANRVLLVGQLVGAGWLIGGVIWGLRKPYRSGLTEISKIQGNSLRSQLMRERLAEESLESPAKLVAPVRYAAFATNLASSLLMGAFMTDEGRVVALASAAFSFLPLIYEDPAVYTWEKHQEYKRKIYGPVSSTGLGIDRASNKLVPTATLTWNF